MELLIGAAAISAVSGIIQLYNGEKARGANKKKLREIEDLFRKIVPPNLDLSLNDPPEYIREKLGDAGLDMSRITPEEFKVIGQYAPEAAPYIAEINPTLVSRGAEGKQGLRAQLDALRDYKRIAQGDDPALRARLQEAAVSAQMQSQQRQASILQDAQRRGMAGSGLTFASMLQGSGDAMARGAAAGRDAAIASNQNRMQALGASASLGGQIAGQDLSLQQTNADIINQFNQRTSKNYQAYLNNRAALQNEAQLYNLKNAQDVSNRNVDARNESDRFNLQNRNSLLQQQYNNRFNERAYQNSISEGIAKWNASEKDKLNDLRQQQFNNQLQRANGMAGIGAQTIQNNNMAAADRNAAIGGVSNTMTGILMNKYAQDQQNQQWDKYIKYRTPNYLSPEEIASFGPYNQ